MANKQTTPQMSLRTSGTRVTAQPLETETRTEFVDPTEVLRETLDVTSKFLENRKETENEKYALEADETLSLYRKALAEAENETEFKIIAEQAETDLKTRFTSPEFNKEFGAEFWQKHGARLLAAHRADTAQIRLQKEAEFGKISTQQMLAEAQNRLATATGTKGENIFLQAQDVIRKSAFLSAEEKESYQQNFMQSGVLNLALHDSQTARQTVAQRLGNNPDLLHKIDEIEKLNMQEANETARQTAYEADIRELKRQQAVWQSRQKGQITPAEYYVLRGQKDPSQPYSLAQSYDTLRAVHRGEKVTAEKLRLTNGGIEQAYQHKAMSYALAEQLQNALFEDNPIYAQLDELADGIWGKDIPDATYRQLKAQKVFGLYQAYQDEYQRLKQSNPQDTSLAQTALRTLAERHKIQPEVRLKRLMADVYQGVEEEAVWQRFFEQAPKVADKAQALREAAIMQQKAEMMYPRFTRLAEVRQAHLEKGDKFYFNGKLTVMKG